jgi:crotonobetainyl-CoA:carnitine CoA-transferase CaiB-like acyl-CoA transferase
VKVEPPGGDPARRQGPTFLGETSVLFLALNRNKRSVLLNLEAPAERARLATLVGAADVLLHDRTPRQARALGLGPKAQTRRHSRLIHCSLTDFGPRGPLRDRRGSELVVQAMAEYSASLGTAGEPPLRLGADVANAAGAFFAFQAILAALIERDSPGRKGSGKGQAVAVSLFGALLHLRGILWSSRSDPDEWYGFHLESATKPPDHGYQTADRPVYFSLGRGSDADWDRLLAELDLFDVL